MKALEKAVKAHRERLVNSGGSRLTIMLSPESTASLAAICAALGVSRTAAIEEAIKKFDGRDPPKV